MLQDPWIVTRFLYWYCCYFFFCCTLLESMARNALIGQLVTSPVTSPVTHESLQRNERFTSSSDPERKSTGSFESVPPVLLNSWLSTSCDQILDTIHHPFISATWKLIVDLASNWESSTGQLNSVLKLGSGECWSIPNEIKKTTKRWLNWPKTSDCSCYLYWIVKRLIICLLDWEDK